MSDFSDIENFLKELDEVSESENNDSEEVSQSVTVQEDQKYDDDLYKKWFRSKTQSGFLAIRPWYDAMKFKIDIGKTSPDGKLLSSTNVFVDAIDFAAYLRSVASGTGELNYPESSSVPTKEGFVSYGGGVIDGKPISRIFKAHHWQTGENYDSSSFVWKCGHFVAKKSDSGAFIPDMKQMISADMIKVTRQDVCSIAYIVDVAINSYAANNPEWSKGR